MRPALAVSIITVALVLAVPLAAAEPEEESAAEPETSPAEQATEALKRGLEHYSAGDYELAIAEFRSGYQLDPRPELLFALAQAERLSGDCRTALRYYDGYLETNPASQQEKAALANREKCERALQSGPDAELLDEPAESAEPEQADDPASVDDEMIEAPMAERPAPRTPWYRDVLTLSLVAGGVASTGVGAWSFTVARGEQKKAGAADSHAAYTEHRERAQTFRTVAWVGAGVGAAAFTGAVVWALVRGGGEPERATAAVTPVQDGALLSIGGRF